jgi:hypothetical protein
MQTGLYQRHARPRIAVRFKASNHVATFCSSISNAERHLALERIIFFPIPLPIRRMQQQLYRISPTVLDVVPWSIGCRKTAKLIKPASATKFLEESYLLLRCRRLRQRRCWHLSSHSGDRTLG